MKYKYQFSIIIPTYNRASMVGITLESLFKQNFDKSKFEIIVIDNNSSDNTKEVIAKYQKKSPVQFTYLLETKQGSHFARNSAAKVAQGEILYFTDDDMIADKNLLHEMLRLFSMHDNIGSATGTVLPDWQVVPPDWVTSLCNNYLLSLHHRPEPILIAPYDVGVYSCHQAIRHDIFFKCGGFNPDYIAGELIGDGETGLNNKVYQLGYLFAYNQDCITHHMIPAKRMTQSYLNGRFANQGNSDSYTYYRGVKPRRRTLALKLIIHLIKAVTTFCTMALFFVTGRIAWRLKLGNVFYFTSRLKYELRLIRDANWRQMVLKKDWLNE